MSRPSDRLRHFLGGRSLRARRRLRGAGEDGFTLIELVIVLVILPLVIGAVSLALIVTLSDSAGVSAKITSSVDAQLTSSFYVRDVQSTQYVTTSPTAAAKWITAAGGTACGSGTPTDLVVSLAWGSGTRLATGATEESIVSYWSGDLAGGTGSVTGRTLTVTRTTTFTPGDVGQALVQTNGTAIPFGTTVASYVSGTQVTLTKTATGTTVRFEVGPTLTRKYCLGTGAPSQVTTSHDFFTPFLQAAVSCIPTSSTCGHVTSTWIPAQPVTSVTLAAMEPSGRYDYNVSATPRVSNATGSTSGVPSNLPVPNSNLPTLLLLGGSTRVIKESSTTSVRVYGTTVMNQGWFQQGNNSRFTTTTGASTDVTRLCNGATASCNSVTPTPTVPTAWTPAPAPTPDPLADMPRPPAGTPRTATCPSGPTHSVTLKPGLYACKISVSGSGHTVTLTGGTYEFADGVSVQNGATLIGTNGVFIYLPCNTVDTWDPVSGHKGCNEQFTVSGLDVKPATGPYGRVWYWQNVGDAATVSLSGPATFSSSGIMYVPGAGVKLSGGSGLSSTLGAIVTTTLEVLNGTFTIYGLTYPTT